MWRRWRAADHHPRLELLGFDSESVELQGALDDVWGNIGGQEEAKRELIRAIQWPVLYPELFLLFKRRRSRGVLLYGPPGCGKTLLGKAVVGLLAALYHRKVDDGGFKYVKGHQLLDQYLGNSEKAVKSLFDEARRFREQKGYPAVLFFDEADALFKRRPNDARDGAFTLVPSLLAEMDGMDESGAFVILATNRPDSLDLAQMPSYSVGLADLFVPVSSGRINVNTAPPNVLQMLPFMDENLAGEVVRLRAGPDGAEGTEDDTPLRNVGELVNVIPNRQVVQSLMQYCAVRSSVFEVTVEAEVNNYKRRFVALLFRGSHNYHFTYQIAATFGYEPGAGQTFTFTGDDDVWVFFDKQLGIDLGGVHGADSRSVNLDTLFGPGKAAGNYSFDFFFAERHTSESNLRIETSLTLLPPSQVPEPASFALVLAGLAGMGWVGRRRRS